MLNLYEVSDLKKYLSGHHAQTIHMHDVCGGQYFTVDQGGEDTEALIKEYLRKLNRKVVYAEDRLGFTIVPDR